MALSVTYLTDETRLSSSFPVCGTGAILAFVAVDGTAAEQRTTDVARTKSIRWKRCRQATRRGYFS
jgi:hypothetical protein